MTANSRAATKRVAPPKRRKPKPTAPAPTIAATLLGLLASVPVSKARNSRNPAESARQAAHLASAKAALTAGTLALPLGPIGWLTILPEMLAVWKIQAALVSDIAAFYGKKTVLNREQMLYCLFKHTASQAVRDLVVRVGERAIVKPASLRALQAAAKGIGVKISQRAFAKSASRWLPIAGTVGIAAYAYYDTAQVAKTAIELFESDVVLETVNDPA
jgi:hypothetical protein